MLSEPLKKELSAIIASIESNDLGHDRYVLELANLYRNVAKENEHLRLNGNADPNITVKPDGPTLVIAIGSLKTDQVMFLQEYKFRNGFFGSEIYSLTMENSQEKHILNCSAKGGTINIQLPNTALQILNWKPSEN